MMCFNDPFLILYFAHVSQRQMFTCCTHTVKYFLSYSHRSPAVVRQTRAENEELREDLSEVTAQHNSVLEENQRLRAKLENLEQVLKVPLDSDTSVFTTPKRTPPSDMFSVRTAYARGRRAKAAAGIGT